MINNALKLAGEPSPVLDISCAVNGVWPILNCSDSRVVIAVHSNAEELPQALAGAQCRCGD